MNNFFSNKFNNRRSSNNSLIVMSFPQMHINIERTEGIKKEELFQKTNYIQQRSEYYSSSRAHLL